MASGQFILRSGLLEITYGSGAKVVLEGPVIYQVASPNHGYLRQGKLTVYVPRKGSGVGGRGSGAGQGGSPPSIDAPLFTLHAPNVVLTDRGGKLGIWVDRSGDSHTYVFDGRADLQLSGHRYEQSSPLRNCWAWVKRDVHGRRIVLSGDGEPIEGFARQALSQPPVAADTKKVGSGVGEHFQIYQF